MPRPTTLFTAALGPLLVLLAAGPAAARTDYEGCVSTELPAAHSTVWYVPGTGELCEPVDCGGGRAPPKTVPGCPAYKGTETVEPKFWSGFEEAVATPAPVPTGSGGGDGNGNGGDKGEDEGEGEGGEDDNGGQGVGVGVGVTPGGEAKGTITVTLGGGGAAASRTGTKTRSGDVEETGAAGKGVDDDEDEEDGDDAEASPSPSSGGEGGKKPKATLTKVMTAVETVDGVVRPVPTNHPEGDTAHVTVSTAGAVPTGVVGKGVFGVVAGVAVAGLVLA
ncbi:uncharacterized protein B0H64DRAFT_227721 [Chaetomium fimeti]|uniref:Uncharacterized protein n=1 Tax=Chaetomium fimeti TaxID=1854472 RepID=A0AAE0HB82_9PEZI|nr:hypothetical protein B0H64DRAFT_227721 [Chaetomium fimeti]